MAFSPTNFLLGLPTNPGFVAAGGAAPVITSDGGGATADVSVNTGDTAVTTVVASDTGTITYSIVGGAEALMFEIDPDTGALAFTETSVDGEYEVIVAATSDWGQDRQTITVTVEEVTYEGPLDLVPGASVAYSVRALSAARLGQPLFTLQKGREIPNDTQEFDADAVTGDAPQAAIETFLDSDEGVLTIWNDQAGDDIHLYTTASATSSASGPTFMPEEFNDRPAFGDVNGAGTLSTSLGTPGTITLSSAIATVFIVAKGVTLFDMEEGDQRFFTNVTGTHFEAEFKLIAAIAGDTFAADTSALALYAGVVKFNASSAKRNGVALTPTGTANTDITINLTTAAFFDLADGAGGGQCCEFILYNSELSAGNQLAVSQNIATYYGITL